MSKQTEAVSVQSAIDKLTTRMEALNLNQTDRDLCTIPNLDYCLGNILNIKGDLETAINIYVNELSYEIYRQEIVNLINNRTTIDGDFVRRKTAIKVKRVVRDYESIIDDLNALSLKLSYLRDKAFPNK